MAATFGSVEWQREQTKAILAKVEKGEKLSESDIAFLSIQEEHEHRQVLHSLYPVQSPFKNPKTRIN